MTIRLRQFIFLAIIFLSLYSTEALATHYRAGEITFDNIGPFTYRCTITTFAENNPADRDSVEIDWGDGSKLEVLYRVNGPPGPGGIPFGEFVGNGFKKNLYIGTHTYPGLPAPPNNFYVVRFYDQNRMAGINNITNSVNVAFYVEDTIRFPTDIANIGFNSSPRLLKDPIDYANVGRIFYHNPSAYDPDGDSLDFQLIVPLQGLNLVVPGYRFPNQFPALAGTTNEFNLNRQTGELIWNVPPITGIFNVAILIREFRGGLLMGTMIRDMQIIVQNVPNDPPEIDYIRDTCVRAGDRLEQDVIAFDPNAGQLVTLTAVGGPFELANSPASFSSNSPANPVFGRFAWNTICDHIRTQPYTVVFDARDNFTIGGSVNLNALLTWQIDVIPPPPLDVQATAVNRQVTISWQDPYKCDDITTFRGFSVWRRIGSNPFIPDYCETGLDGRGYTRLNETLITDYNYVDNTVNRGQNYCYRVLAHFSRKSPNGIFEFDRQLSVPSDEVCVNLPFDVPVITNVSVEVTDVAVGQNFVAWSKPKAGLNALDTIQSPPPYKFELYHSAGFNLTAPQLIQTFTSNSYHLLNDTTFIHNSTNTAGNPNSYQVVFYANNDTVGDSNPASSVLLDIAPSDRSLRLSWQESVPWLNDSFAVFRQNKLTLQFDSIAVTKSRTYVDTGLENDSIYCYFVRSFGHYSVEGVKFPIINNSQEKCAVPIDTTPPCPPVLRVRNECEDFLNKPWDTDEFVNELRWFLTEEECNEDAAGYKIYYGEDNSSLQLLFTINNISDSLFNHVSDLSLAGCYAVTAFDRIGNESAFSNIACIDNCPFYILPNTFTPNGDGKNDFFRPFKPYRFVSKIELAIYNRWGEKVFETTDPEINWDGRDYKSGKDLSEGIYIYGGYYYERRLGGDVRRPLPAKDGGGIIHLMRGGGL